GQKTERHRRGPVIRSLSARRRCSAKLRSGPAPAGGCSQEGLPSGSSTVAQSGIERLPLENSKALKKTLVGHAKNNLTPVIPKPALSARNLIAASSEPRGTIPRFGMTILWGFQITPLPKNQKTLEPRGSS